MRKILNLNKGWYFHKNVTGVPPRPADGELLDLPHTWNAKDGQDGGNDYFRGTCAYSRMLKKADLPQGMKIFLEINGANSSADIFMNGKRLAHHDGGYATWRIDLSAYLREENELTILVDNAPNETVYPQTADFTFYGGLYRDVNLICVPDAHFDLSYCGGKGLKVTPIMRGEDAQVEVQTWINARQVDDTLQLRILDAEGAIVDEQHISGDTATFTIGNAHPWDGMKDPYLYTLEATLLRNEEQLDSVSTRFGCRSFRIDPERGFILNGKEYSLRGVSRHQDRWAIGNALLKEHHDEDMALICEVGFNTIRLAHYQHDQYFYDLCDEKGLIIWAEIPYISRHMPGGRENTLQQMRELIVQCYHHPSICVWGLSNEITMDGAKDPDMLDNHRVLNALVHEMDKTRPTTMAVITMCGMDEEIVHVTDLVSYNHYFGWYGGSTADNGPWFDEFHRKYPNKPIGCSEYGCEALNWHNSNPQQGDYSEEYQAYYHEELIKQFFSRPYIWATHAWNMFDFGADARAEGGENGQNHKGLITIDRKYKKDAFYAYKAWLSNDPFVHICGKRYIDRVEDVTRVTVYSNQPEVELIVNGESIGIKKAEDHFFRFDVCNNGETTLLAVAGNCRDDAVIRKVESMNPDYILREQGAVLNWFDITEVEGCFSLNDKIGDIVKTFRGKLWFGGLFIALARKQSGPKKPKSKTAKKAPKKKAANAGEMGNVMNLIGNFTVLRFTSMLGMRNISFTKEELLKLNSKLNKIHKPR